MHPIDIDTYLRQATPFRFVDEVRFSEHENLIKSSRFYEGDEAFFAGHFPGDPVVPGVILLESMAQSCRVWFNKKLGRKAEGFIASIERAKFIRPVKPGDLVSIESKPLDVVLDESAGISRFCRFSCASKCNDKLVAKVSIILYQKI